MFSRACIAFLLIGIVTSCNQKAKPTKSSEKPAKVEAHPSETDIFRI